MEEEKNNVERKKTFSEKEENKEIIFERWAEYNKEKVKKNIEIYKKWELEKKKDLLIQEVERKRRREKIKENKEIYEKWIKCEKMEEKKTIWKKIVNFFS